MANRLISSDVYGSENKITLNEILSTFIRVNSKQFDVSCLTYSS